MRWDLFWFIVIGIMVIVASLLLVMYLLAQIPHAWEDVPGVRS